MSVILVFQIIAGMAWLSVMAARSPSLWRLFTAKPMELADFYGVLLVGMGAVQAGFSLRWMLYPAARYDLAPGEFVLWASLYFTSAAIALASHWVPRHG